MRISCSSSSYNLLPFFINNKRDHKRYRKKDKRETGCIVCIIQFKEEILYRSNGTSGTQV